MKDFIVNPCFPYTYRRVYYCVKSLLETYGEILSLEDTYISEQGRNIYILKLGKGKDKILFAGAIHGREYVTTSFLLYSAETYARAWYEDQNIGGRNIRKLLAENSFYIAIQSNPDSVEIALGRAKPEVYIRDFCFGEFKDNANGVNLNANFPFEWEYVPLRRHGGVFAASEKETKALINLCENHNFNTMVSLHCRGGCIYWRDGVNGVIPKDREVSERIADMCKLSLCGVTEKKEDCAGGFENWFRYRFKRVGLCVELVDDVNADFNICVRDFYRQTDWENTQNLFVSAV